MWCCEYFSPLPIRLCTLFLFYVSEHNMGWRYMGGPLRAHVQKQDFQGNLQGWNSLDG